MIYFILSHSTYFINQIILAFEWGFPLIYRTAMIHFEKNYDDIHRKRGKILSVVYISRRGWMQLDCTPLNGQWKKRPPVVEWKKQTTAGGLLYKAKVHECAGAHWNHTQAKISRRYKSWNSNQSESNPKAGAAAHYLRKPPWTAARSRLRASSQGAPAKITGEWGGSAKSWAGKTAYAGGAVAKFSVRSWKEVRLKYRVIERFRGIYPIEAMCEVFEVSRSGYYAWRRAQKKMPRDQWLIDLMVQCQQQCNQDLRHPPCSPLNPAAEGKNGESKGTSARHA